MINGTFSGTQSLHFLGNSGDAINILGVHEPMHRDYAGNENHKIIDPLVEKNPAFYLSSDAYKKKVSLRSSKN